MSKAGSSSANKTVVAVLTADAGFEQSVRSTFGASGAIELRVVPGSVSTVPELDSEGVTVIIVDLDAAKPDEMLGLDRMMQRVGTWPPVVVVTQTFDAEVARSLLQMK